VNGRLIEKKNTYRGFVGKVEVKSSLGKPGRRWVINIKMGQ
jgi:hypothetical protein